MKSSAWAFAMALVLVAGLTGGAVYTSATETGVQLPAVGYDEDGRPGHVHVVTGGDTLWDLSATYLKTPWVWPSIWKENPRVENPHRIFPGDKIWISEAEMRRVTDEEAAELMARTPESVEVPEVVVAQEEVVEEERVEEPEEVPAAQEDVVEEVAEVEEAKAEPLITIAFRERDKRGLMSKENFSTAPRIVESTYSGMLLSEGHRVYIDLGAGEVEVGDRFNTIREASDLRDPHTRKLLGHYVERTGWLEVVEVGEKSSTAIIRDARREIQRGDALDPRQDEPEEISVYLGETELDGLIVYIPDERTISAWKDVVFIKGGAEDGIEPGKLLEVVRYGGVNYGSLGASKALGLPDEVVAHLVVLETTPKTSMVYVVHSADALAVGDVVHMAKLD